MDRLKARIDNLPDIPALESVQQRNETAPVWDITFFTAFVDATLLLVYYSWKRAFAQQTLNLADVLTVTLIAFGLVLLRIVPRFLWPDLVWKTDSEGLTERSSFRTRLIPWRDISKVYTRSSWLSSVSYVIQSDAGTVIIPGSSAIMGSNANSLILASIWQHLRRVGKSEGMNLTKETRSFWYPVPENTPREAEWTNPAPVWPSNLRLRIIAIIGVIALLVWIYSILDEQIKILFGFLLIQKLMPTMEPLRRISVNDDQLDIETIRGIKRIKWHEVTSIKGLELIYGNSRKKFRIPLNPDDPNSVRLANAVIQHLRSEPVSQAVQIPAQLMPY